MARASPLTRSCLVDQQQEEVEREIDRLVYLLYDLTPEEIEIVERVRKEAEA